MVPSPWFLNQECRALWPCPLPQAARSVIYRAHWHIPDALLHGGYAESDPSISETPQTKLELKKICECPEVSFVAIYPSTDPAALDPIFRPLCNPCPTCAGPTKSR